MGRRITQVKLIMTILIVAATAFEVAPIRKLLNETNPSNDIYFLISGVGAVPTCFHLSQYLLKNPVDLVINAGIAGAFDTNLYPIGTVVEVERDRFADLGAEFADGHFEDVFEMGLENPNKFYQDGWLINRRCGDKLQQVSSLTLNKVTGQLDAANILKEKYEAALETMEGAAVAFTCLQLNIPFHQIRAVSNKIEDRNKENWNIPLAIKTLNNHLKEIIFQK